MIQPCDEIETRLALNWAIYENPKSTYIRLVTIPVELNFTLPVGYTLTKGQGVKVQGNAKDKKSVAIVAYGPVMLREAVKAAQDVQADVFNFPWLNRINPRWIREILGQYDLVVVIDDHYKLLGLGNIIATVFGIGPVSYNNSSPKMLLLGLEEIPACGQNDEVLKYHKLDAESITTKIREVQGS